MNNLTEYSFINVFFDRLFPSEVQVAQCFRRVPLLGQVAPSTARLLRQLHDSLKMIVTSAVLGFEEMLRH